jgi:scyllo-inositol 2-dehydrogenase (NADP+)
MRILIYGFGRMGLTHYSILNGLRDDIEFSIVEPNRILRKILKKNIKAKFYNEDVSLTESFHITLITTPPSSHRQLLERSIERGDKKIFIEKPFGGHTNIQLGGVSKSSNVNIGYVLRFNPCIQWVKRNIDPSKIKSVHGEYISNTIEKKPEGWRNGPFSGVLNEMGSHVIDLVQYIIGSDEMTVLSSKKESVISDIDDIVEATLKTQNDISVTFYFNWVNKDVRKPMFNLNIQMENGSKYSVDQQQINKFDVNGDFVEKVSVVDIGKTVPYYLRGVDFTDQMQDLVGDRKTMATIGEALEVNRLIAKILK